MMQELPILDIHLPESISWWPPAPGWWLVSLLMILLVAGFYLIKKQRRKNWLKKTTLHQLDTVFTQHRQDSDTTRLLQALSILMRRSCISYYPRIDSAGLTGQAWLQYLDATTLHKGFEHGVGKVLATAPYYPARSTPDIDTNQLHELCTHWLVAQSLQQQTSAGKPS